MKRLFSTFLFLCMMAYESVAGPIFSTSSQEIQVAAPKHRSDIYLQDHVEQGADTTSFVSLFTDSNQWLMESSLDSKPRVEVSIPFLLSSTETELCIETKDLKYLSSFLRHESSTDDRQKLSSGYQDTTIESLFLTNEEFSYAGHIRYTIDGAMPRRVSDLNTSTLIGAGSFYIGLMVALHVYQINTFWAKRTGRFTIHEDGDYAKGVDKFGHIFGATLVSYYSTEVLQGAGVSVESARIWGTLMGLTYQTYIEIEDGLNEGWGFSPTDMYGNVAGASFYLLQFYVPILQSVTQKWIYTPSKWIGEIPRSDGKTFIDDYSSSTFFFSLKLHNVLPESWQSFWPRWLGVAGGYAARGPVFAELDPKYILALDYDLPELLPDFEQTVGGSIGRMLNWFKQSLNYIKLPSPAIEVGQSGMTRFNLLYPFKLSLGGLKF